MIFLLKPAIKSLRKMLKRSFMTFWPLARRSGPRNSFVSANISCAIYSILVYFVMFMELTRIDAIESTHIVVIQTSLDKLKHFRKLLSFFGVSWTFKVLGALKELKEQLRAVLDSPTVGLDAFESCLIYEKLSHCSASFCIDIYWKSINDQG